MALHHHKHELRNVALGLGLLGIIAYVLFRPRKSYVVNTSASPTNQPITLPADAFGVPGDFNGLDGQGLPFTSYAPKDYAMDPGAAAAYNDPPMTPDPSQIYNPISTCGC